MDVNNLPKIVVQQCPSNLSITSPTFNQWLRVYQVSAILGHPEKTVLRLTALMDKLLPTCAIGQRAVKVNTTQESI